MPIYITICFTMTSYYVLILTCQLRTGRWVVVIIYFSDQLLSLGKAVPWRNLHVCCHTVKTFRSTVKKQNSQHPFILPSHFPSGLSVRRIISISSPCLTVSSFFPPLWSTRARAWWRTWMDPVNCRKEASKENTDVKKLSAFQNIWTKEKNNSNYYYLFNWHLK